jgi:hypothetical protein
LLCFSVWNAFKDAINYYCPKMRLPCLPIPATNEILLRELVSECP